MRVVHVKGRGVERDEIHSHQTLLEVGDSSRHWSMDLIAPSGKRTSLAGLILQWHVISCQKYAEGEEKGVYERCL